MWQTYASASYGYFYARSAEFMQSSIMQTLVWIRMPGDVVFSVGVGAFAVFMYQAFVASRATARLGGSLKTREAI
jgi:nitric oxide reductase subunit B